MTNIYPCGIHIEAIVIPIFRIVGSPIAMTSCGHTSTNVITPICRATQAASIQYSLLYVIHFRRRGQTCRMAR